MTSCIEATMRKISPKIKALLRTRPYYSTSELVRQFKTHILGLAEANIGAIYHARQTVLDPLDRSLDNFLRDIQLDARSAFLEHNMAPLSMRRDIAMLGFLHKRMLGDTHVDICSLLPLIPELETRRCTRSRSYRPSRMLEETFHGSRPALIRRSIFGLTRVYNKLPQHIVDSESCNEFQHHLNAFAHDRCRAGAPEWKMIFSPRRDLYGYL